MTETGENNHEAARLAKLHAIEALGIDPWGGRFDNHMAIARVRELPVNPEAPSPARLAGRVVLRRVMGNVHFLHLQDASGRVQVMLGKKQIGELGWKLAQELDLGDLVAVDGTFGNTKTGEPTVFAREILIQAKSLLPHPDKHSGMSDTEFRLRHRYLDLTYHSETMERAKQRVLLVRTMRRHLDDQEFLEVETPTLHAIAGGAAARPFTTHHNALDIPLVLRIALELPLKRLLVGGMEKVYEIGRVFRNEGISPRHNPEFTMLELYQAYSDYRGMMELTEGLLHACAMALRGSPKVTYGGAEIDFTPPFERATYAELLARHAGADMADPASLEQAAAKHGINPAGKHPDVLAQLLFEQEVEHRLIGPVFVHDYPASLCPLTRRKRDNPAIAERFELFVRGMELANAYSELNDPVLQEATFRQQLAGLPEDDSMARMDDDFVRALRHGMPPAGGLGIGVDRLAMLLTETTSIRDVILFPLLRPERPS